VQAQNHLEVKKYTPLLYMGVKGAKILMQCSPALGRIVHASFSTLGTKLAKNLKWTDLSAMRKSGMGRGKKLPQY
jgi:hypothetical protein